MAVFQPSIVGDSKKIESYLYKLNEDLVYMFNNLTPEDNYSKSALQVLSMEQDKVAELSVSVDGIFANYLKGDSLIASIGLDDSGVTIKADKISLEGLVTANNNFKILLDGSIEANNGKFTGAISSSTISSTTINGGDAIRFQARPGYVRMGDFVVDDEYGRHILQSVDECTGMSTGEIGGNQLYLWAGWGRSSQGDAVFMVDARGRVMIWGDLYVNGKLITGSGSGGGGGGSSDDDDDDGPIGKDPDDQDPDHGPGVQG